MGTRAMRNSFPRRGDVKMRDLYEEVYAMCEATTKPTKYGERPVSATERHGIRRALVVIGNHMRKEEKCSE